jgi:hypothetical protein
MQENKSIKATDQHTLNLLLEEERLCGWVSVFQGTDSHGYLIAYLERSVKEKTAA